MQLEHVSSVNVVTWILGTFDSPVDIQNAMRRLGGI